MMMISLSLDTFTIPKQKPRELKHAAKNS